MNPMRRNSAGHAATLILIAALNGCAHHDGVAADAGAGPDAKPPVTDADLRIVKRAREILDSPAKWNRADTRICPRNAKTFSLYCALEEATIQVSGDFAHRGAAMQEARFVIDEIVPNRASYEHRLMGYNNDPTTTFADIQRVFDLMAERIEKKLKEQGTKANK
jgi:hypothetical protein